MKPPKPSQATEEAALLTDVAPPAEAPDPKNAPEVEPEPEPEPWTAERVLEWNAYYDVYMVAGVLALTFIASAYKIVNSSIWPLLQAGKLTTLQGWPVVKDPFSYTMAGRRWVNIPWLFEWINASIYQLAESLTPQGDRATRAARAAQIGAGTLVALNATIRTLTAFVLIGLRKSGPGLWWVAVCVGLALAGIIGPMGPAVGGIADRPPLAPETWGMLFLAVELVLLQRAADTGRSRVLYALIPLFLLWANVDQTFAFGLLVLGVTVVGIVVQKSPLQKGEAAGIGRWTWPAIFGGCAAVCLVNPSLFWIYPAAFEPYLDLFRWGNAGPLMIEQLSFFGSGGSRTLDQGDPLGVIHRAYWAYYLVLVGVGLGSFYLNRRRFSLPRLLTFMLAAALWAVLSFRFQVEFALVFAAVLALNGQEWYRHVLGTEGRLSRGWAVWSIGGRAITIVVLFAFLAKGLTGYGDKLGQPVFGFGVNTDEYAFEAARFLSSSKLKGNVLNTTAQIGDALIWQAKPAGDTGKTFLDTRSHLFPASLRQELEEARKALLTDDVEKWKPILDAHDVTVVALSMAKDREVGSPSALTYPVLLASPNWVLFHDDGNVALFGRKDAPADDLAFFEENRLDANEIVYKRQQTVRSPERPPLAVSFMDEVFRVRSLTPPQSHSAAADRWLKRGLVDREARNGSPDPAHCIMAIREARTALSANPDDPDAFLSLSVAYGTLYRFERELLTRDGIDPPPYLMAMRTDQLVTSLDYAIQTFPPPAADEGRETLRDLNLQLAQVYQEVGAVDLARDRLVEAKKVSPRDGFPPEAQTRLNQLNEVLDQLKARLDDLPAERANPMVRMTMSLQSGALGAAIVELREAQSTGVNPSMVKPRLVDLYCQTGQPDLALELLSGNVEDPELETSPGMSARRQGLVNLLVGNLENAEYLWGRAVRTNEGIRVFHALEATQAFLRGDPKGATRADLEFPTLLEGQAFWQYELGLALLESGDPKNAGEQLTGALSLQPALLTRPVIAYYLEKIGLPVPPKPAADPAEDDRSETPAAADSKPRLPQLLDPASGIVKPESK